MLSIDAWREKMKNQGVEFQDAKWPAVVALLAGTIEANTQLQQTDPLEALDAAARIQFNVLKASFVPGKTMSDPKPEPKRYDYAQQTHDGARLNHARVEKQQARVALAANDVNSPIFQERNAEAKAKFEDLVARGPISYRRGREDRGLTIARREILQKIRVVARQRDSEGAEVPLYSEMVKKAEEQIRQFEAENARREMS